MQRQPIVIALLARGASYEQARYRQEAKDHEALLKKLTKEFKAAHGREPSPAELEDEFLRRQSDEYEEYEKQFEHRTEVEPAADGSSREREYDHLDHLVAVTEHRADGSRRRLEYDEGGHLTGLEEHRSNGTLAVRCDYPGLGTIGVEVFDSEGKRTATVSYMGDKVLSETHFHPDGTTDPNPTWTADDLNLVPVDETGPELGFD